EQSSALSSGLLLSALNIANQCEISYRTSKNQRLQIELALLKMCHLSSAIKLGVNGISATQVELKKKLPESVKSAVASTPQAPQVASNTSSATSAPAPVKSPIPSPVKAPEPEKKSF